MDRPDDAPAVTDKSESSDSQTDGIDLSAISDSGLTRAFQEAGQGARSPELPDEVDANIILIAHPDGQRLGLRFLLSPEQELEIGRSRSQSVSLPEVPSVSRRHARLVHRGGLVTLEDLGSTNGTYVNGDLVTGPVALASGDRFQIGAVHFKFLHELDVEHAYYEAIYDLVTRDGLTDIYNKRKYTEEAEREFARARRHERPLALIFFDLDDFKEINDSCGHLCGDFVLKRVASTVRELLRPEQVFARIGGDEFVVLVPETDIDGATTLAGKLCALIGDLEYRYGGESVRVTCSFGVAELDEAMEEPEDLFRAADRALYRSKHGGGGRVTTA